MWPTTRIRPTTAPASDRRARIAQIELYRENAPIDPPPPPTEFLEEENILAARVDTDVTIGGAALKMHTWVAANGTCQRL
jgi:hypothetical protein